MSQSVLLNHKIYHPQGRRTVVFLHGMLGDLDNWNTQARNLSNDFRIITVDLRNHGSSPHLAGMSYRDMADDVRALLHHLGVEKVTLSGHSMGGKVAMMLALTTPQMLENLIVVDISPVDYPLRHQTIFEALLTLPVGKLQSRREADQLLSHKMADPFERGFLLKNLQPNPQGGFQWRCNLKEIARNYLRIKNFPTSDQTFSGPTLFIAGAQSDYILKDYYPAIRNYFPQARIHTIANAGHLPHVQQAAEFSSVLLKFIGG